MFERLKGVVVRALSAAFSEPDPLWDAYVKASQSELNGAKQAEAACRRERDELRDRLAEARATSDIHVAAAEKAMKERDAKQDFIRDLRFLCERHGIPDGVDELPWLGEQLHALHVARLRGASDAAPGRTD